MKFETKHIFIALAIALVIILVIYFAGKKAGSTKIEQVPLPDDNTGQLSQDQLKQVRELSRKLHDDMDGLNLFGMRNTEIYNQFTALSDTMFVAVYNDFNTLYAGEDNGTLRAWIDNETGIPSSNIIIDRMNRLNLT